MRASVAALEKKECTFGLAGAIVDSYTLSYTVLDISLLP